MLRPATLNDWRLLLVWRNDEKTRLNSHNTKPLIEQEHKRWLVRALSDPMYHVFIWMDNGIPAGCVLAQYVAGRYTLSWVVAPERRGKGIGRRMVAAMILAIDAPVRAEVKTINAASVAIAESCGMCKVSEIDGVVTYEK